MAQDKHRFDATWLPFGMMIGVAVGIGTGMILLDSLLLGAIAGMLLGLVIGIVLGFTPRRGEGTAEEAEDEYVRRQQEAAGELPPGSTPPIPRAPPRASPRTVTGGMEPTGGPDTDSRARAPVRPQSPWRATVMRWSTGPCPVVGVSDSAWLAPLRSARCRKSRPARRAARSSPCSGDVSSSCTASALQPSRGGR